MVTTRARRDGGLSVLECIVAMAVITVIAGGAAVATSQHFRFVTRSWRETVATRAVSSELERVGRSPDALHAGAETIALDAETVEALPGATAVRTVAPDREGLVRVEVRLRWREGADDATAAATTLVAVPEVGR